MMSQTSVCITCDVIADNYNDKSNWDFASHDNQL